MPPKRMRAKRTSEKISAPPPQLHQVSQQTLSTTDVQASQDVSDNSVSILSEADARLQQELAWCLEKLERSMDLSASSTKQAEEARKAWRNLSNPKTPLVKKRQIMRLMFGDYRAKMEQEDKQFSIKPQNMSIRQVPSGGAPKSKYLKSSSHCPSNILDSTTRDFEFKFNLSTDTASTSNAHASNNDNLTSNSTDNVSESAPCINYYYMEQKKSAAGFTFDFDFSNAES